MHKKLSNLIWAFLVLLSLIQPMGKLQLTLIVVWLLFASLELVPILWEYARLGSFRQYREYLYHPLDSCDLSPKASDDLDLHTPAFHDLGFGKVEDTRLMEKPYRHDVRIFLNARGDIWGEINFIDNQFASVACTSVFEDGMKIETASVSQPPEQLPEPRDRMQWNCLPGGTVEEIHQRHLEAIERYQTETGAELLVFAPEDIEDVITYGHRLYWHWRRRRGLTDEAIPEAVIPQSQRMVCGL